MTEVQDSEQLDFLEGDDISAYVVLTCGQPSADGKMNVEMVYEGDRELVRFLLTKALASLDQP
ncbi:hypothetical protein C6H88_01245 [Chlamydia muridarum str. Nigg]|uniref:Uncharacterized protein n=2 Tax=Chlamydia muridarum TaxID=83560 RepID=A0A070A5Z6_CHLMR|nr:hypothetical protein [Chlamydia muridarum]AAF39109.1 conserved hypothetical protein [Chlamydia muridarum str. Nigg]AHH22629.1 hypothetical protein TAC_01255 [Chlamydia muridarum str. Nigg3 CMUT3-5]AHH23553.1 hypothetical protein Y015_01255 [Chlamydia muridarum str. Nigg CM972]AID37775.1 hypothetical protein BB17_01285 [Chlamydia muridarum str. Nigg 2 MCR]AIT90451.1 hypothetical protein NC80_01185 [Chlamydia muridarum]